MQARLLTPGDKLKDYEVIAPLTSGGMATLVLARRRGVGGFSRLVALKLVHPHLAEDHAMINMFLDEARISAHVVHPNVVHVEEVGVEDGIYFIAMEYVHGASLAHFVKQLEIDRRRMSPTLAVCLAAQVAEALHAAHEARGENGAPLHIVHRDVSPQNILLAHTGHAKLIDFGIAKSQAALHQSRTGQGVLGKLRYMSPEQLSMGKVDRRTDVYALGVMLWEMLTAKHLFRCARLDDPRDQATRDNPPPPSKFAPLVKSGLDRVVQKAIAPDPEERYATALDFRRALLRAQPEAARVDAPKLAAMFHAVVGSELDQQRAALPREVTRALALADTMPQAQREQETLSELTQQFVTTDLDSQETAADRVDPNVPPLRDERFVPTHPAPSLTPEMAKSILKPHGVSYASLVVSCVVCTVAGLWVGRWTAFEPAPRSRSGAVMERITIAPMHPDGTAEPIAEPPHEKTEAPQAEEDRTILGTVEVTAIHDARTTAVDASVPMHASPVRRADNDKPAVKTENEPKVTQLSPKPVAARTSLTARAPATKKRVVAKAPRKTSVTKRDRGQ